jgi:cell division protein FtsW
MSMSTRLAAELRGDRVIWAIIVLLAIFSILAVYSATSTLAYRYGDGNTEHYLLKHTIILMAGLGLVYLCHLMPYNRFSSWAPILLAISIPLLLYTLIMGTDINQAKRWIELPIIGITFQTSDLAKLAIILYVARALSSKQEYIKDFKEAFLPIIVPVLMVCLLIAPADLSSALLIFLICITMMIVGRVAVQYIMLLVTLGIVSFAFLLLIGRAYPQLIPRAATWEKRVSVFFNPEQATADDLYQIDAAKIAMARGGLIGVGPGNSTQRNYLPSPYADFIYAIIVEEYGVIGGILVIGLYLLLFFRVTRLITKSPKAFGAMVALGLSFSLIIQAYLNIAVATDLVPVTGLTLPLVSMGGTSMLFTCVAFGIILSVSKYIENISEAS